LYSLPNARCQAALEHKDDHAKVEKIAREVQIQGNHTDIFLCSGKQGQSCEERMMIKEIIVKEEPEPVAL